VHPHGELQDISNDIARITGSRHFGNVMLPCTTARAVWRYCVQGEQSVLSCNGKNWKYWNSLLLVVELVCFKDVLKQYFASN